MKKILVIDDDRDMCLLLNRFLTRKGFEVAEVYSGKKALIYLSENEVDAVLCDYRLEDMNGKEILAGIMKINPAIPVIIITAYSDVKAAVDVTKMGAFDYVTKPLLPDEILLTIKKSLEQNEADSVDSQNGQPKANAGEPAIHLPGNEYIFGNSPIFNNIISQVKRVAPTNFSVIIYGESGCGKEVIAQTIHKNSKRAGKPFVAIDCGTLSRELAGSEFFGHEKGSFTGAVGQKTGSFEIAMGGTIFLDEIANLSYDIQVSLLRVMQERKIRRVGGTKDIEIDIRFIVASNERLNDAVRKGKFREDLFHRFNEFSIEVPPLRERRDDIPLFLSHFLKQTSKELDKTVDSISPEVNNIFMAYQWPGNLRELKNVIKRSVLLTDNSCIETNVLPFEIVNYQKLKFDHLPDNEKEEAMLLPNAQNNGDDIEQQPYQGKAPGTIPINEKSLKTASLCAEYNLIVDALKLSNYNKSKAARILDIDRKTLYNKMKEHKLLNAE